VEKAIDFDVATYGSASRFKGIFPPNDRIRKKGDRGLASEPAPGSVYTAIDYIITRFLQPRHMGQSGSGAIMDHLFASLLELPVV
jgi:hypothetical protein